jgi:hypothetical protein
MPASESRVNHRDSSPKVEVQNRGRNTAVAEIGGSGRQSRKRGKNGVQKETNMAKEADQAVASESGGSPTPARVDHAAGTLSSPFSTRNDFAPSAVLDALNSAEKVSDSDGPHFTGAWAQTIPLSKSPSIDLLEDMGAGVSPPTVSTAMERGGFSNKTPPSSPPTRRSRPVSSNAGMSPPHARQPLPKRSSRILHQPFGASSPPPPHLPQAHFYGVPDIDLGLGGRLRDAKPDGPARFVSFAELDLASSRRQKSRSDAVLLALEDRLDIITLEKDKLAALGALDGVGGAIVDAKVLTWESGIDRFHHLRPLVSLVVHGPRRQGNQTPSTSALAPDQDPHNTTPSADGTLTVRANECTDFQTTVEIYSLATQEHLTTLMWSQSAPGLPNIRGLPVSVPPPVGSLKLDARGNFLTVSSGTSGEVFVFAVDNSKFVCIAKLWTSVRTLHDRRHSSSSNSTDADASPADVDRGGKLAQSPILSLSSRWLAIVPPGPTSCQSLPITVAESSISTTITGMESHNAPPRPPVSCALESPDAESFINRVARGVAQEVVRGARWIGGQGLQTWNNYWNRDQYMNAQGPAQNRNIYQVDQHLPAGIFPPTHAPETRPTSADPQLVSIIDLHVLAKESYASSSDTVTPLATFQPPNGISFLSFSPDGLAIVSATKKGDIQYVWDLKQIRHLRAGTLQTNSDSETSVRTGKVTQVARFARLTPSSIVDIVWKCPSGDRFAVITKNGTIHIFDLPLSAFQWPPIRRSLRLEPSSAPASPAVTPQPDEATVVGGVFSSAMKLAGKTQPMLANLRGRAPSIGISNVVGSGNSSIGFASATGIRGSKAVAAGLSRSVGAATGTVNSLRHVGENRLHLGNLARNPAPSHVHWSHRPEQSTLLVIDGQGIKSFRVSRRRSSSKPRRQALSVIDPNPRLHLSLPASEHLSSLGASSNPVLHHDGGGGAEVPAGYWASHPPSRNVEPSRIIHPLSCAEIETNAPYQPFHSDRRVSLFVYNDRNAGTSPTDTLEPWVFGNDFATTRLDIRPPTVSDEEEQNVGASVLYRHTSMTSGEQIGSDEAVADQIVITTRRRKTRTPHQSVLAAAASAAAMKPEQDDGFFEDDCDVLDFAEDRV